jgi:hypothetical protein
MNLSPAQIVKCFQLKLWDPKQKKMVAIRSALMPAALFVREPSTMFGGFVVRARETIAIGARARVPWCLTMMRPA